MTNKKGLSWHWGIKGFWIKKTWLLISYAFRERSWSKGENIKIKGNLTKVELWGQRVSPTIQPQLNSKRIVKLTGRTQLQTPKGKEVHCTSYKKLTRPATHPMRNNYHHELALSSNGLSFKITASNSLLLLLHKITFLSFVCGTYRFCHSLHAPDCNFLNKLYFHW